ncbi:MAG: HD-GYP domain-containing protein [Coriobacteriales bacterium]|nr:HD-GYP domain-containing protein [Coriobacteriales bacterium]
MNTETALTSVASSRASTRARDILTRIASTRRAARLYPLSHPAVHEGLVELEGALRDMMAGGVAADFAFYEGEVMLGDQLLVEESLLFDQLVRELTDLGVGALAFKPGVSADELGRAIGVLSCEPREAERDGGLSALLEQADLTRIEVGTVKAFDRFAAEGEPAEAARGVYDGALTLMREVEGLAKSNLPLNSRNIHGAVRALVENVLWNRSAMLQLTGLRSYDEYTFFHSANVAILSLALGARVTEDTRFLMSLGTGALLHDLGKLAVDTEILNKPGSLTREEWAQVRRHPVQGAHLAAATPGMDRAALITILEHHMRYDGLGYPQRSPRRPQHVASRIVAVADTYDAMTSQRPYSAARANDEAIAILVRQAGTGLDPTLVRLFVSLMGVYPPRTVVRLSSGEVAIVLEARAQDLVRPLVRIISDTRGTLVSPRDIDLSAEGERSVAGCVDPHALNVDVEEYV